MALDDEISIARKDITADGYDMSVGEVMNLYRDNELTINPAFQRLFRWNETQKTRFIESLLLGIPIPPIFVVQDEKGTWELIDGLQRLSTVLEFSGLLRDTTDALVAPSILEGTTFLPSLSGKRWESSAENANDGIGKTQQLQIKRARLRVEILKKESDAHAKYELFQRLNTGGAQLTAQEVRNSVAVMINPVFYTWLQERAANPDFIVVTAQTATALEQQMGVELVLRFLAFRSIPYRSGLDVHEYLDHALEIIASNADFPFLEETVAFNVTFSWLRSALGEGSFKKWNAQTNSYSGKFLMSAFEVIALGISKNILGLSEMNEAERKEFIIDRVKALWTNAVFANNSGAGVRGTTRLSNLLPMAVTYFAL